MKVRLYALIIFLLFGTIGCYATITGTVVDAETGEPIEGAVVLVEWTKTHGFGLTYTESYKVIEAVTDKEGKVTISGIFSLTVNPPHVTLYKKGYVAWNNEFIFPDYEHRKNFRWRNGYVFRLEQFKADYSYSARKPKWTHDAHFEFIDSVIHGSENVKFKKAMAWEENKARTESEMKIPLRITGKVVDAETGESIEGAVVLVKGIGIGYTRRDKALEFITDKDGAVILSGVFPMLVNPPGVTVYKEGYIAWNSRSVFPRWELEDREDFKWQEGYVFKLEKWKSEYNKRKHIEFIYGVTFNAVNESKFLKSAIE